MSQSVEIPAAVGDEIASWRRIIGGRKPGVDAKDLLRNAARDLWTTLQVDRTVHPDSHAVVRQETIDALQEMAQLASIDNDDAQAIFTDCFREQPAQGAEVVSIKTGAPLPDEGASAPAEENRLREITLKPAEWEGIPVPPRRWLSRNRIPMCEVTGLGGDGGIGKTQTALQAAVRVATNGSDWLGSMLDEVGPSMFFTAEEPENEIHFRLDQIRNHHQLTWAELANVHPVCPITHSDIDPILAGLVKRTGKVVPTKTFAWLREMALDIKAKLLCIEAASDVFDVDEIVRGHAKACIRLLQGLAIEADAAVLLLYHPSLSGIASGRGTSGSTQWNNTMRSRLFFQTLPGSKDDDPGDRRKVLEVMKANRGPTGEKVVLEWRNGLFVPPSTTMTVEQAARQQQVDLAYLAALRRLLAQNQDIAPGKTSTNSAAKLMRGSTETKGIRNDELFDAQQRLLDANVIVIEAYGPPSRGQKRLVIK
jgi:RecA-family ATPase